MSHTALILAAAQSAPVSTYDPTTVAVQPTAARCASSSRTCCVSCVRIRGLSVRFGALEALRHIDLDVRRGEILSILGPNGSGKTTLIECLTHQRSPTAGSVSLFGERRPALDRAQRARLAVVLQESRTDSELSVSEHLEMVGGYYGAGAGAVELALARVGLVGERDRRIHKLSGGQRRKLEVATALIGEPDLLVLDEPTTGLDIETRERLWSTVRETRDRGTAIVLTTHDLEEAEALADRIVVLVDGDVVVEGDLATITDAAGTAPDDGLRGAYLSLVQRARAVEAVAA